MPVLLGIAQVEFNRVCWLYLFSEQAKVLLETPTDLVLLLKSADIPEELIDWQYQSIVIFFGQAPEQAPHDPIA